MWDDSTNYIPDDLVYNENGIFKSITNNINSNPSTTNTTDWKCIFDSISLSNTLFNDLTTNNKTLINSINELDEKIGDINTILETI